MRPEHTAGTKTTDPWVALGRQNYQLMLLDQSRWIAMADELLRVGKGLARRASIGWKSLRPWMENQKAGFTSPYPLNHELLGIYFMVNAIALENLLKAAIVREHKTRLTAETEKKWKLPETLAHHDLRRLVRVLQLNLSEKENALLGRLTISLVWAGRYPVPKTPLPAYEGVFFSEDDAKEIHTLTRRLRRMLAV